MKNPDCPFCNRDSFLKSYDICSIHILDELKNEEAVLRLEYNHLIIKYGNSCLSNIYLRSSIYNAYIKLIEDRIFEK